ncbi:MAG TPA: hypothetical protein VJO53_08620 [Candidatus Acidoferrales bacterium]|nr:hypothetical protein [Candidatus Acidoferrales bacterium]
MSCPICEKRPPKRLCPAKGEKICAVCCGREREVTIDCPLDCPHLIAAHRYEAEHRKPVSAEEFPFRDLQIPPDFVYERWPVVTGVATTILGFQNQHRELDDGAACAAIGALAETHRTLETGIYYERPPDAPIARALYGQIARFLQDSRKNEAARVGLPALKDSDIFHLLVFLLRVAKQETNGRLRSRAFLSFLRARFPLPAGATSSEGPRIVVP